MPYFTLTDASRETLVVFCAANLKTGLDAARYADGLIAECDNWDGSVVFEVRGSHAATGNPATISFSNDDDFDFAGVDA